MSQRDEELLFARTLEEVRQKAKEQGNIIREEEIKKAFSALKLSEEQLAMVYDYLRQHKIGVGGPVDPEERLTGEDMDYLQQYLQEINGMEAVSAGEREAVTLSAMAGEAAARNRLIALYLPEVVDVAKLYAGQGALLEDLIGEGNVALAAGVEMLGCLETAAEAQGMLGKLMMDAMEALIAGNRQNGEAGQKIADKVNRVADMAKELSEELLHKVTAQELAAENGITEEEVLEAVRLCGGRIEEIEDESYANG